MLDLCTMNLVSNVLPINLKSQLLILKKILEFKKISKIEEMSFQWWGLSSGLYKY